MMRNFLLLSEVSFTAAVPPASPVKLTQAALQEHDLATRDNQSKPVDIGIDSEKLRKFEQHSHTLAEIEVRGGKSMHFPLINALNLEGTKYAK